MEPAKIPPPPAEFIAAVSGKQESIEMHARIGKDFCKMLRERCRISPTDTILDIGSGCGRIATHFAGFTTAPYHGLDVVLPMVEWCRANISAHYPNFEFHHAALKNTLYSSAGQDASTYTFPFADVMFDVAFAASVFTHLVPTSAKQYAREVHRVLKYNGRGLLTFFLMNDERRARIAAGKQLSVTFPYQYGGCRVALLDNPELRIAFEQSDAIQMCEDCGLKVETVSLGAWAGDPGWTYQDAILVSRR
jgi:ubiquinone/menaquinone biosynthesis C-methylase UbiE